MTPAIVWLASYPKSGNTWIRVFIENYTRREAAPADINCLSVGHAAQRRLFQDFGGLEASELADDELQRLRPSLYRTLAASASAPVFLKVHDAWGCTADNVPLVPADATVGTIYILRNPCDVAVSLAFHDGVTFDESVRRMCRKDWYLSDSAFQCRQNVQSWSDHIRSWIDLSGLPVAVIRYEDLLMDPARWFGSLLVFAQLPLDATRLHAAIEDSSFRRLQAEESARGFVERPRHATAPFFRTGAGGKWVEHLEPVHVRQLVEAHGDMMYRFGYLTEAGEPVT